MAAGAALALLFGRRKHWPRERLLAAAFTLGCLWMTLLGPATEGLTWLLLAPAAVIVCFRLHMQPGSAWLKALSAATVLLLVLAVARNSLMPRLNHVFLLRAFQPIAGILFVVPCLGWLFQDRYWRGLQRLEFASENDPLES